MDGDRLTLVHMSETSACERFVHDHLNPLVFIYPFLGLCLYNRCTELFLQNEATGVNV